MTVTTIPSAGITDATIATADIADDAVTAAKAAFSAGKIGQVVSVTHTADQTSTSTSFADVTNLNASITPSATTSKILVLTDIEFYVAGSSQGINGFLIQKNQHLT